MVIKSVVGNLRLSLSHLTHFPTKVDSLDFKVAGAYENPEPFQIFVPFNETAFRSQ